ncbi:hypothetical protein AGRA3207_007515 [Actinomadura graeca]|uniref:Uncharacterized protein n=1 Tax=Actinomadura graeca TaxID=2750812 RepID=A0ABX8R5Y8_9ACTN|nr:hypothetical protein [Actinomadura graeca]QXJ25946.1 hypothetical protein AGRA3207_007515 [Actinomadura graeca]
MPRELKEHGTPAAYERHRRNHERPCEQCRLAHNAAVADYQRRTGRGRARQRAMTTLARHHPQLFASLHAQAWLAEPGTDRKARVRARQAALRALAKHESVCDEFEPLLAAELHTEDQAARGKQAPQD